MKKKSPEIPPAAIERLARVANDDMRADFSQLARMILAARRRRQDYFDPKLFYDPSWEILLDLRAHHGEERSAASLFVADFCPPTTGLRHLRHLRTIGLVERWVDPGDARRRLVKLSEGGLASMDRFLSAILT